MYVKLSILTLPDHEDEAKVSGDEEDEEAALAAEVRAGALEATAPTQVHDATCLYESVHTCETVYLQLCVFFG